MAIDFNEINRKKSLPLKSKLVFDKVIDSYKRKEPSIVVKGSKIGKSDWGVTQHLNKPNKRYDRILSDLPNLRNKRGKSCPVKISP